MARPAPSIDRAVSVFSYLSDHPDESFTLSELARRLELNKATCHAMFGALERHGLLLRHPVTKSYRLGPALIGLAEAVAPAGQVALDTARAVMGQLTDELGLATIASTRVGDEIVVIARRLPTQYVSPTGHTVNVGARTEWAPPIGLTFAAWSDAEQREAWLARRADNEDPTVEELETSLAEIRRRGCEVCFVDDPRSRVLSALSHLPDDPTALRKMVASLLVDLADEDSPGPTNPGKFRLHHITAPVFGRDGSMVLSISLDGFPDPLTKKEIDACVEHLLAAVTSITQSIHGQLPADWPRKPGSNGSTTKARSTK